MFDKLNHIIWETWAEFLLADYMKTWPRQICLKLKKKSYLKLKKTNHKVHNECPSSDSVWLCVPLEAPSLGLETAWNGDFRAYMDIPIVPKKTLDHLHFFIVPLRSFRAP